MDHRTDLFSLGAVLYEMATGRQAFTGSSIAVIFDAILNRMPTAAARVNPELPDALDRAIGKALDKDPGLRVSKRGGAVCGPQTRQARHRRCSRRGLELGATGPNGLWRESTRRRSQPRRRTGPATERTPPRMADELGVGGEVRAGGGIKPSQETRQRTIDALCQHFATETLDNDEFERRVDLAHRVDTVQELRDLVADLPALGTGGVPSPEEAAPAPAPRVRGHAVNPDLVRDNQVLVGLLSGAARKGNWIPPRHLWSVAVMGGVDLDFREARMGPGVIELSVFAIMGGIKIIVPPDLQVESDGIGIMGGFECSEEVRAGHDPDAPILKINGLAMMGHVEVKFREPGETALDAWRRRRSARKERRRQRRG